MSMCKGCGQTFPESIVLCYHCYRDLRCRELDYIKRKKRLVHGRYSRQQALKFGLIDEDGFLTFDGLDDHRKFGCC